MPPFGYNLPRMKYTISQTVLLQELDGETVILDIQSGRYLGLDAVATAMWKQLLETQSVDAAVRGLVGEYDVAEARLRSDLEAFVARLVDEQLIRIEP